MLCIQSLVLFIFIFLGGKGYDNFSLDINKCVRELYKCSSDAFCNNKKGLTTVYVNLDSLEMEENVKVNVGVEI